MPCCAEQVWRTTSPPAQWRAGEQAADGGSAAAGGSHAGSSPQLDQPGRSLQQRCHALSCSLQGARAAAAAETTPHTGSRIAAGECSSRAGCFCCREPCILNLFGSVRWHRQGVSRCAGTSAANEQVYTVKSERVCVWTVRRACAKCMRSTVMLHAVCKLYSCGKLVNICKGDATGTRCLVHKMQLSQLTLKSNTPDIALN